MIYNTERPTTFDEMVGQERIVENIRNQSKRNHFFPVFVLCGQYGSGKTTMARLIAMAANCEHKDQVGNPCGKCESCQAVINHTPEGIIEIDGASNNGVENIRHLIVQASMASLFRKKVIVIDEAHMLSKSAFNALLITLENPPEHCIFILCSTQKDEIPETIRSRAPVYEFGKIPDELIKKQILRVAKRSEIGITEDAASLLTRYANGAMRNALQLLEHLSMQKAKGEEIEDQDVIHILGLSSFEQQSMFLQGCLCRNIESIVNILRECESKGVSLKSFIQDVLKMNTDLLLVSAELPVIGTEYYLTRLNDLKQHGKDKIIGLSKILSKIASIPSSDISAERITVDVISCIWVAEEETLLGAETPVKGQNSEGHKVPNAMGKEAEISPEGCERAGLKEDSFVPVSSSEEPFDVESEQKVDPPEEEENSIFGFGIFGSGFFNISDQDKHSTINQDFGKPEKAEENDSEMRNLENQEKKDIQEDNPDRKLGNPSPKVQFTPEETKKILDWDRMAELGFVPKKISLPVPESEEELEREYEKITLEKSKEEANKSCCTENLHSGREALEVLLKNPGFKMLYKKASIEESDKLYLVFQKQIYVEVANAFLEGKSGITAVLKK